jgi:hypothetical protein
MIEHLSTSHKKARIASIHHSNTTKRPKCIELIQDNTALLSHLSDKWLGSFDIKWQEGFLLDRRKNVDRLIACVQRREGCCAKMRMVIRATKRMVAEEK